MTQITFNVSDWNHTLQHHISLLNQRMDNLYPLMDAIGQMVEDESKERFLSKKAPDGVSWASLAPSTQAKKGNNNILVHSGDLQNSIHHYVGHNNVVIGTDRHYSQYHQLGTKHIPARPFLGLGQTDKQRISELINSYLAGEL